MIRGVDDRKCLNRMNEQVCRRIGRGCRDRNPTFHCSDRQDCFEAGRLLRKLTARPLLRYDADGYVRWSFEPEVVITPQETGLVSEKYITAVGHLLAIKLPRTALSRDAGNATPEQAPKLLWELNLGSLHRDQEAAAFRQFIPGWERLPGYAAQLNAWYPCGPMTRGALPVIAGRRLFVFDPLMEIGSGNSTESRRTRCCSETQDTLIVLSETSRQVEVRRLADGELLKVSKVPDWWIDATKMWVLRCRTSMLNRESISGGEFSLKKIHACCFDCRPVNPLLNLVMW